MKLYWVILVVFALASCQEEDSQTSIPRQNITSGNFEGADVVYITYGDTIRMTYHEFEDGVTDSAFFDIDMNGVNDFCFDSYFMMVAGSTVKKCRILGIGLNAIASNETFGFADTLAFGQVIDSSMCFSNNAWLSGYSSVLGTPPSEHYPWLGLENRYVGFRLYKSSYFHYGWMGLTYLNSTTVVVRDVAFIM